MPKTSSYTGSYRSRTPDARGHIPYGPEEDGVWRDLVARQEKLLPGRVCPAYLEGLATLDLPRHRVPQLAGINARLAQASGFGIAAVPALILPARFFGLLAERRFPVATFLRRREDFDYLQEPDLFHEVFGHCPMLAHPAFADVLEGFGRLALVAGEAYIWRLQRLFWFTVEFGLIEGLEGLRIYGAGIASSPGETIHALESDAVERLPLDPVRIFRTPYRIDIFQSVLYVIESFEQLHDLLAQDLRPAMDEAKALGMLSPSFPPKKGADAA
jgi:phenylalanine-4-hydroxylase